MQSGSNDCSAARAARPSIGDRQSAIADQAECMMIAEACARDLRFLEWADLFDWANEHMPSAEND